MAKKRKFVPRTRRGPKRDPDKWDMVEWIEARADSYRLRGQVYGAVAKAAAAYVEKFFPPDKQTAADVDSVRKSYKNACDEWRQIDRINKTVGAEQRALARAKRLNRQTERRR